MLLSMPVSVNLKPSEAALEACEDIHYAFDTLIRYDGFNDESIMRRRGEESLLWKWAIVTVGQHSIPAPINVVADDVCELYDHSFQAYRMDQNECACATAVYYLDMLVRFANSWTKLAPQLHPAHRALIEPGARWISCFANAEYFALVAALKGELSDSGYAVLD